MGAGEDLTRCDEEAGAIGLIADVNTHGGGGHEIGDNRPGHLRPRYYGAAGVEASRQVSLTRKVAVPVPLTISEVNSPASTPISTPNSTSASVGLAVRSAPVIDSATAPIDLVRPSKENSRPIATS